MKKNWYSINSFLKINYIKALTFLTDAGVTPDNIKILNGTIYYYHDKEVK